MLSNKTSEALDIIVGGFFNLNRTFDRAVSIMVNKWAMPNAGDIVHHNLAHIFPLLADVVSGFKDEWNIPTYYPETHGDGRDYENLLDMTEVLLKECLDNYEMIKMTYKIAVEEEDLNAVSMLIDLTKYMTIIIGQVYTLRDKAEQMPTGYDNYDRHISSWGIKGIKLE